MELTIGTPVLLFSTVSLLMIAFTNRFMAISSLIRELHTKFNQQPSDMIEAQLKNLRSRVVLIRNMQIISVASLLMSVLSMFLLFQGEEHLARWFFGSGLIFQLIALVMSAVEITISTHALQVELSDMEIFASGRSGII